MTNVKSVQEDNESQLVERARGALSNCNWVLGECASLWTEKYARGRTDADFGNLIGLSGDQVYQRRRVWETYGGNHQAFSKLSWSHFYVALNWDDSEECLGWAEEMSASVAEMRAWRRANRGEDLSQPNVDESIQVLDYSPVEVKDVMDVPFQVDNETSLSAAGEMAGSATSPADPAPYTPFRKEARGFVEHEGQTEAESATAVIEPPSPEKVLKKATGQIERMTKAFDQLIPDQFSEQEENLFELFSEALEQLNIVAQRIKIR